jgi:Sulfatase
MRKHLLLTFSLANLCFYQAWREVLSPEAASHYYFWPHYPGSAALGALALNVALLTALFLLCYQLVRRFGGRGWPQLARICFVLLFLLALNSIYVQMNSLTGHALRAHLGRAGLISIMVLLFALIAFVLARYGLQRLTQIVAIILLILSPFGVLGFVQATWQAVKYERLTERTQPRAPLLAGNGAERPRVLWLIFDELDERVAFSARPASVRLPELDRLQRESFMATNAFPPGSHTLQSLPALLTGQLISAVKPVSPNELLLTIPPQPTPVNWSAQPDIFTSARAAGLNTAVVGWYHPYCRVIGAHLNACYTEPASQLIDYDRFGLSNNLLKQERGLLYLLPFTIAARANTRTRNLDAMRAADLNDYRALLAQAKSVASDPKFGLLLVHLPVPHPPNIYDRSRGDFATDGTHSYLDNLALMDRTLGELRQAMEQAGTWEHTTVVVSSDHWWRTDYWRGHPFWTAEDDALALGPVDHRVPFLVKLAEAHHALTYEAAFNTVLTHDLIIALLDGKISNTEQIATWLDAHRTIGESPYESYDDTE